MIAERAKANQGERTDICQKSDRSSIDTKKEVAKLAKCIAELERILGIKHGNNQHTQRSETEFPSTTQAELAEQLKLSEVQVRRYKKLLDLVPELQTAVEEGKISVIIGVAPRKRGRLFRGASNVTAQIIEKCLYLFYTDYNTE